MKKILAVLILATSSAAASSVSYDGNLDVNDANSFALFQFTITSASSVNIQTWGYGGGTNAAGQLIGAGGFDPYVSLFSGFGNTATFIASNDDGLCPPGNGAVACHDSTLNPALTAGNYTVALSVFENMSFAENLGSGTLGDGLIGLGGYYDAASNTIRSPAYAIDISSPALTPEPSTLALLVPLSLLLIAFHCPQQLPATNSYKETQP